MKIHTYYRVYINLFGNLQESQVNSIICLPTTILYMKHLLQKIKFFGITVIYIFGHVNMMVPSYFYMKLTGRFRWMTHMCHLCSLQHWKLYHVWKNMTIVMMTVQITMFTHYHSINMFWMSLNIIYNYSFIYVLNQW